MASVPARDLLDCTLTSAAGPYLSQFFIYGHLGYDLLLGFKV
jgi:hypothetical protein